MRVTVTSFCSTVCLLWAFLCLTACDQSFIRNDLEAILSDGHLTMITRDNASCYYHGPNGPTGFEYDLAKAFADHLGVQLKVLVLKNEADMIAALRMGKADIIAAGFPFGEQAAQLLAMGPGYLEVQQMVVGRRGGPIITSTEDLADTTIWITASSAHLDRLKQLQTVHDTLNWQISREYDDETMLELVWNHNIPLTLVGSNVLKINHRFFPELKVHLGLDTTRHLAWAMQPGSRHLQLAVAKWFALPATRDFVDDLIEYYFSHLDYFDYVDMVRYRQRISRRLPKYQDLFKAAAEKHHFDWQLIAAQAYQESHWNPKAISFTGVRGIMMLTLDTARELGVANRLSAEETIYAGTQYLARLHNQLADGIAEPDRTFMALAAYNMGMGHIQDARSLAQRLGKSDATWGSIRLVLPLLQQRKHYQNLEHGYARGSEAVQYVDRIRTYYKVLKMAMATNQQTERQNMVANP